MQRSICPVAIPKKGLVVLFFIYILLVGWIGCSMAPNKTELGHMAATVYFWKTLRFDVFCVNPPSTRIVSALPVALCQPNYDSGYYSPRPQDRAEWEMGAAFVRANSRQTVLWSFTAARWSLIPLLVLGGYYGYRLSREIYGSSAGFLFLPCGFSHPHYWLGEQLFALMLSLPHLVWSPFTISASGSTSLIGSEPLLLAFAWDCCHSQN